MSGWLDARKRSLSGEVSELADERDLGSRALGRAGSTPVSGTFPNDNEERNRYGRIKRKSLRIKLYS